jgi:hypothetical protein
VGEVSMSNLKTAKSLGLAVSLHLQQLTDEVIDRLRCIKTLLGH